MNRTYDAVARRIPVWLLCGLTCGALFSGPVQSPVQAQTTSAAQNPSHQFLTPGQHQVTQTVCNQTACDTVSKMVTVLDPRPSVTSAAGMPVVEVGQLVPLSGAGKGKPPLSYSWQVLQGTSVVRELFGTRPFWDTAGLEPGAYTAVLTIRNAHGTAESLPVPIALGPSQPSDFYTMTPCRVLDTRTGAPLASGALRTIDVARTAACGIPAEARAVAANVTVVSPTGQGYVTLFPGNYPRPVTSTVNFNAGVVRANSAILPLATDGSGTISAFTSVAGSGSVDLIVDISGYFLPQTQP